MWVKKKQKRNWRNKPFQLQVKKMLGKNRASKKIDCYRYLINMFL